MIMEWAFLFFVCTILCWRGSAITAIANVGRSVYTEFLQVLFARPGEKEPTKG
jgi:hypothetical protein